MKKYIFLFIVCCLIYIARFVYSGHGIYGDGNGYWSYTHALYFQHSLDFKNIYRHLREFRVGNRPVSRLFWQTTPTKTGELPNHWLIGTGIFWLPGVLLIDLATKSAGFILSPYNVLWELGPGITGVLLGTLGCYFIELTLRRIWNMRVAVQTVFILIGTTNLMYYVAVEPALSHSVILFINSLFLYLWLKLDPHKSRSWAVWGILAGLSTITRITGVFMGIFPLFTLMVLLFKKRAPLGLVYKQLAVFAASFIVALIPQLWVQQTLYGSLFHQPYAVFYTQQQSISLWWLPQSLLSVERGLFFWHPVFILACIGLFLWAQENRRAILYWVYPLGILLAIGFWGGALSAGFGNRFFIEALPIFACGIAYLVHKTKARNVLLTYGILSVWNLLLFMQFLTDKVRMVDQQGLTYLNLILGQFTAPFKLFHKIVLQ